MQSRQLDILLEVLPLTRKTSFITFSGPPMTVMCSRLYFPNMEIYIHIELLLNILRFHICYFVYLLKFICSPQINSPGAFGGGMNWEIGIDIYTLICIK